MKGRVRIIGGQWKRSRLTVTDTPGLRPTTDRMRETLFNWLGQELTGWRCLDMFAGSGALGFEAGSRGAAYVLMIEQDPRAAQQLRLNQNTICRGSAIQSGEIEIVRANAMTYLARLPEHSFDLIFLDPPFSTSLIFSALHMSRRLLRPGGLAYAEHTGALLCPGWSTVQHARTRQVQYYLLTPEQSEPG
jgi:16S rRNA (guanine966-N2)-methyltransferase